MSNLKIIKTSDNSNTIYSERFKEHYHSINGAIQESNLIFIDSALKQIKKNDISVFELGFGTGLNAFLTLIYSVKNKLNIYYESIELYPVPENIWSQLNYSENLKNFNDFFAIHNCKWNSIEKINQNFTLMKIQKALENYNENDRKFDIVYFDAFSPEIQPEMWKQGVFEKMFNLMNSNSILTTYSAKGQVRKNLQNAGFKVERIPGPAGKREITRALKI